MFDSLKELYRKYLKTVESNKETKNLYKAKKHALLALAYWKDCKEDSDIHIQIEGTSTYVRLGK